MTYFTITIAKWYKCKKSPNWRAGLADSALCSSVYWTLYGFIALSEDTNKLQWSKWRCKVGVTDSLLKVHCLTHCRTKALSISVIHHHCSVGCVWLISTAHTEKTLLLYLEVKSNLGFVPQCILSTVISASVQILWRVTVTYSLSLYHKRLQLRLAF